MTDNSADAQARAYYKQHAKMLANVCRTIYQLDIDLDYLERTVNYGHTVGPVMDPAGYRDGMNNLRDMERLVKAMKAFRSEIEAVAGGEDEHPRH